MSSLVLVVEDHDATRTGLERALRESGYRTLGARDGAEALGVLARSPVDLVLSDHRMAPMDGLALLREVRRREPLPFVLYSAGADARTVFEAGRAGATSFLAYPFCIREELLPTLAATLAARSEGPPRRGAERLVGVSPAIRGLRASIRRVARFSVTVLLQGDTGTGKELAARAIHEESGRGPFVSVSLPELSEGVLESELFGHRRGAFTGAVEARAGLFEAAAGGTLFLDEIGDATAAVQVKLLRALETREVRPVGSVAARPTDVRVVAATHRDLEARVRSGSFREDLWFRIRGAVIRLPPLRDRTIDLPVLAAALLADIAKAARVATPALGADGLALIARLPWRGNVRELRSLLENAVLWWKGAGPLGRAELLEAIASLHPQLDADDCALAARMLDAWRRAGWNQEAARRELGWSRAAWRTRLARVGLDIGRRPR
ncbi:MAG TPA: sigma-54 dependent transcriptional regulator [Myxococcota bacterium]|nr:sigma-54 dependent transcriptional regulator [Myxococcota bacterium]